MLSEIEKDYQMTKQLVDASGFKFDYTARPTPQLPESLRFWITIEEHQRENTLKTTPKLWLEGEGAEFLKQLSVVNHHNEKCRHWLPIMDRACREFNDDDRLGKVLECLSTHFNCEG